MLYADTVRNRSLSEQPVLIAIIFAVSCVVFALVGLHHTLLALPFLPQPEEHGLVTQGIATLVVAGLFTLNILLISRLRLRLQIFVVWAELFMCFLIFFFAFDLNFPFILTKLPFLLTQGVFTTLYVSAISITIATVLAIFGAIAKLSSNGFAFAIASFYTSMFRGLPLLVQIYLIYLGLPQLGIFVDAVPAGVIALSLCYGAYMTEIFRAGIMSIDKGQWEAARSIGFKFGLTMRRVILPQAVPIIVPPLGNQFIAMLKDSSLVSVLGVWELMYLARTLGQREFRHLEMLLTVAIIYWVMTIVFEIVQGRIESYFQKHHRR
ncbi:amino acid ABC transporter permease [Aliiroseovarius subalbicans]|uniref:amino acid ABC transporter permease n=1 Tax=Aliiroseovarius subalbicans TaxID=2925840 RepID=UPI001F5678EB|nr:amino acid ABC transporter permease [Aliiroseovarius subalbicans]MCI2397855.1 amino acid ABC transporter permease [Aliiroseovarius subalbicans]